MKTTLMTGAITSSDLVAMPSALDAAAQAPPMTSVMTTPRTMPAAEPRMPIARPRPTRMTAWTSSWRTSRISRPTSRAPRLAGVTRSHSMTPSRHSPIRLNPAKNAPKRPSWTSSPGTRKVYGLSAAPGN